ncbi:MAG: hypothetical protein ACR2J5_14305, partial [Geodermatophilaceae bacterium]
THRRRTTVRSRRSDTGFLLAAASARTLGAAAPLTPANAPGGFARPLGCSTAQRSPPVTPQPQRSGRFVVAKGVPGVS